MAAGAVNGLVVRGRRAKLIGLATGAILAGTAGTAWAAPATITTIENTSFGLPSYPHDAGTVATLNHTGGGPHDVTATTNGPDGKALFRSATISSGSTPVNGTQFAPAGSHTFICTVHPNMQSMLNVTGTPLPRPAITVKIRTNDLDSVADNGKLPVKVVGSGSAGVVDLTAKLGGKTLGSKNDVNVAPGQSLKTKVKLTKSGKNRLGNKDQATVKLTGAVDFGSPDTAKRKLS